MLGLHKPARVVKAKTEEQNRILNESFDKKLPWSEEEYATLAEKTNLNKREI